MMVNDNDDDRAQHIGALIKTCVAINRPYSTD